MQHMLELPDWLESCRPDDSLYADAYENTAPSLRALLKTALAFAFHRWPMQDGEEHIHTRSLRTGFSLSQKSRPAEWVIAALGAGYASPARFISALAPAIIAGVNRILIVSEDIFSPPVCTAMELAGLENSYVISGEQMTRLYKEMRALSPYGCVLVFPDASSTLSPISKKLLHICGRDGVPTFIDTLQPRILSLCSSCPQSSETERRLRWLYPDAKIFTHPSPDIHAAFVPEAQETANILPLPAFVAGPHMEACWPGPSPHFFRSNICEAYLFQE